MKPRKWKQGDPLSASRLNDMQEESFRSRRSTTFGKGSSAVNETLGNHVGTAHSPGLRLAIAIEDFAVPDLVTDCYPVNDPVPMGQCLMMRLNIENGQYEEESDSDPFYAWDASAHLTGSAPKVAEDIFYTVFNKDSKRWEVLSSSGSTSYHLTFQVVSHDPVTRIAICQIEAVWPDGPVPDSYLEDSVVDVCDMAGCYFNHPSTGGLTGVWGQATYMAPRVATACEPNEYPPYARRWIVHALCCPPTCSE